MSRIGKAPIVLPENVTVEVSESNYVTVAGPKGKLEQQITGNISVTKVEQDGKAAILLVANDELADTNAKHGLYRALLNNMIVGVWVGNDDFSPMDSAVTGGTVPAEIFRDIILH